MDGLTAGRIVNYVWAPGEVRPMIITKVVDQEKGIVNGTVFVDGPGDVEGDSLAAMSGTLWLSNIPHDAEGLAHTWDWPRRL